MPDPIEVVKELGYPLSFDQIMKLREERMRDFSPEKWFGMEERERPPSKQPEEESLHNLLARWQGLMGREEKWPREWREGSYQGLVELAKERSPELKGLPTKLIMGLMKTESELDPWAKSPRGAIGLMQVRPEMMQWLAGKKNLPMEEFGYPEDNIFAGMHYLDYLWKKLGNITGALHAYNVGPTAYAQGVRNPAYVRKVLTRMEETK